jgi:hypothetical protein
MKSIPRSSRFAETDWLWLVVGSLSLMFTLSSFVPWQPYIVRTSDLDDSWMLALNSLFGTGVQFGRDVVFTYGPWGFIDTRSYHPNTWTWMLVAWTFFALVFWRVCWVVCRRQGLRPAVALVWLVATAGIAAIGIDQQRSTLFSVIALLAVYYFYTDSRPISFTLLALLAAVSLASLVKFTYMVAALLVIFPITADQLRRRQFPIVATLFAAFFAGFYLLAGQRLSSLGSYLRVSWKIAAQYTDAMSCISGRTSPATQVTVPPMDLLLFVAAALVLLTVVLIAGRRVGKRESMFPLVAIGGLVFLIFKWGYVRHDEAHTALAGLTLIVLGLLCVPSLKILLPGRLWSVKIACVMTLCALISWQSVKAATGVSLPTYFIVSVLAPIPSNVRSAIGMWHGTSRLPQDFANALESIRGAKTAPRASETLDVYPWNQAVAIAFGATYRPRPVFQSYAAFSPELARLNTDYLESRDAPKTILFSVRTGGAALRHFPAADDGLSWPILLTEYDIQTSSGEFLLLRKAPTYRRHFLLPISDITAKLGEPVQVPSTNAGPVWVQIAINPTARGKLLTLLYKSPELYMTVSTRSGKPRSYRLVAGQAEAGFLLSPAVDDNAAFTALSLHQDQRDKEVKTITLSDRGLIGTTWAYHPNMSISFSRLQFESSHSSAFATSGDAP